MYTQVIQTETQKLTNYISTINNVCMYVVKGETKKSVNLVEFNFIHLKDTYYKILLCTSLLATKICQLNKCNDRCHREQCEV